jgi:hypothetical protein
MAESNVGVLKAYALVRDAEGRPRFDQHLHMHSSVWDALSQEEQQEIIPLAVSEIPGILEAHEVLLKDLSEQVQKAMFKLTQDRQEIEKWLSRILPPLEIP